MGNVLILSSCRRGVGIDSINPAPMGTYGDLSMREECEEILVFDSVRRPKSLRKSV